ncbi:unnamed protein product [Cylicocyclus nassatus]|uniref:Uncharacterized protein n=1 Tax=Cylicocyclus nassatus TaxID=53992 RepID=A0AA36MCG9_CYLNA|nr:unnamed protein product [Cylicocyclus nassatus]
MRSSHKSFAPNQPILSYNTASPLTRSGSSSARPLNRYDQLSNKAQQNQYRDRGSFLRETSREEAVTDYAARSKDVRRSSDDRKAQDGATNSRIPRSEETNALLERYGVRKSSNAQTAAQTYLQQRRQQQQQSTPDPGTSARRSLEGGGSTSTMGDVVPKAELPKFKDQKQTSQEEQITQSEYIARLLAAHNRVDELLKSRGLSAEDESKYLRAWKRIPILRKQNRVPTTGNSSDSGLSTDDESEPSTSESLKVKDVSYNEDIIKQEVFGECMIVMAIPPSTLRSSLTCRPATTKSADASFSFGRKPSFRPLSRSRTVKIHHIEEKEFVCLSSSYAVQGTTHSLKRRQQSAAVTKVMPCVRKGAPIKAVFKAKSVRFKETPVDLELGEPSKLEKVHSEVKSHLKTRLVKPAPVVVQQKTVLSNLVCRAKSTIPSNAEISIQHCSFYQVAEKAIQAPPEKNVRLNLRLTERAPKNCSTVIALPTTTRPQFAHLAISTGRRKVLRRSKTVEIGPERATDKLQRSLSAERQVGKLHRSLSPEIAKESKQQRKVNRLVIPDSFLHLTEFKNFTSQEKNEMKGKNDLEPPKEISKGQTEETTILAPASEKPKRKNVIRRRTPPSTSTTSDILKLKDGISVRSQIAPPTRVTIKAQKNELKIVEPTHVSIKEQKDEPKTASTATSIRKTSLNFGGSLDRAATSRAAVTHREFEIAEMSPTDRALVEQFRQKKHIPRPKVLPHASLPSPPITPTIPPNQLPVPKQAEFMRFPTPPRIPLQTPRQSSPGAAAICLRRVYRTVKQLSTKEHFLEFPTLKKVDHTPKPPPKLRRSQTWTPSWRRSAADEESGKKNEEVALSKGDTVKGALISGNGNVETVRSTAAKQKPQTKEKLKTPQNFKEILCAEKRKEGYVKEIINRQEKPRLESNEAERRKQDEQRSPIKEGRELAQEKRTSKRGESGCKQQSFSQLVATAGRFITNRGINKGVSEKAAKIAKVQQTDEKKINPRNVEKKVPLTYKLTDVHSTKTANLPERTASSKQKTSLLKNPTKVKF